MVGRPKGSKTQPKAEKPSVGDKRHNGGPPILNDDQRQTLAIGHSTKIEGLQTAQRTAVANLRNAYKLAKAELGEDAKQVIDQMILLKTPEGEVEIKARMERLQRAARWMGMPMGAQSDMFEDRRPDTDRAFENGKIDRLASKANNNPHHPTLPQHDAYEDGYRRGGELFVEAQRRDDGILFDAKKDGTLPSALAGMAADVDDAPEVIHTAEIAE